MDNRNVKPVQNPLLQNATYGFPLDNILSTNLIIPVSQAESTLPETAEIDSFIGQESTSLARSPAAAPPSNLIVNESAKPSIVEQSVPLVVPPSTSSHAPVSDAPKLPTTGHLFGDSHCDVGQPFLVGEKNISYEPEATFYNPHSSSSVPFFSPESANQSFAGNQLPPQGIPQIPQGPTNSYRLGNLKRATYAPVPGLSSSGYPKGVEPHLPHIATPKYICDVSRFGGSNQTAPFESVPSVSSFGGTGHTGPFGSVAGVSSFDSSSHRPPTIENMPGSISSERNSMYRPVYHHWFYRKDVEKNSETKYMWKPFSMADSLALESAFTSPTLNEDTVVATDGGRYDVNIKKRQRIAVYWQEEDSAVRRCSWFSKGVADTCFAPYEEEIAAQLEEEYKIGMMTCVWNRKVEIDKEEVVMHSMSLITHQVKPSNLTIDVTLDSSVSSQLKPRVVKRGGFDDFDIDDGEPEKIDHLLFLIHGIGQFCDLKFRSIIEVVDEFRSISLQLTQSHFQESCELGEVNRIEILPVSWHKALHSEETGVDQRLKNITLPSIPRMRDFSNDTILDVLFYTSPVFCQVIINAVASEMNRLQSIFLKRNPNFTGKVSVGGHSLGSLIMFDLLSNQPAPSMPAPSEDEIADDLAEEYDKRLTTTTRRISVVTVGKAGTGQPLVKYPRLNFHPRFFFAFGSPIACFVATRSNEILGEDFHFPTCKGFFNIFHPYDPIAYRIEPLVIPSLSTVKPVQVSHHKGRKRMHLELKDTVSHVGQKLVEKVKNTWNMMYHLAVNKSVDAAESVIQQELSQVLESSEVFRKKPVNTNLVPSEPVTEFTNAKVGCLNEGRRVDYVLQEAPVEYFNEYLFALASHLCYWTSRDTMLLVLKEIYGDMGVYTDNQLPQTILPFDITDGETPAERNLPSPGVDPTQPMGENVNLGPPPMSGFVGRK